MPFKINCMKKGNQTYFEYLRCSFFKKKQNMYIFAQISQHQNNGCVIYFQQTKGDLKNKLTNEIQKNPSKIKR